MEYLNAINNSLALVLWAETESGEDDVVVYSGTFIKKNECYFLQRDDGAAPEIQNEWLSRIKPVPDDLKDTLLGCNYQLSLTVGNSEEATEALEGFGLKWPSNA